MRRGLTGPQFETVVVAEFYKLCRTLRLDVELMYLRTKDGREVDLMTKLSNGGYIAWEIKAADMATQHDARHLQGLSSYLDGPLLAGIVIYQGHDILSWGNALFAVPAHVLFGQVDS